MKTIISGTVSLLWFRNKVTEKLFAIDIFSLADQNLFDKSFLFFLTLNKGNSLH